MSTIEGVEVFRCEDTEKLYNGGYATINMSQARANQRTKEEQDKFVAQMFSKKYDKHAIYPPETFKIPKHPRKDFAECDCKHKKEDEPASVNWDREKKKLAQMVNDHIIRVDDNPAFDFVNCTKTSVLWDPHWSCCRKRFDAPGCTLRKHVGPAISDAPDRPDVPNEDWKTTLKKNRREDQKVMPHLTAKEWDGWRKTNPYNTFKMPNRQLTAIHNLLFDLNNNPSPVTELLMHLDHIKFSEIVVFSGLTHFQLKFDDCMPPGLAYRYLDDGNGNINVDDFSRWLFGDENIVKEFRSRVTE